MVSCSLDDYQLSSIVASCCGGAAVVYSALHRPSKQNVALKRYFVDKNKENDNLIQQEIQTWKEMQHPNILPYLTSFVHGHDLYVVSPLMEYGSCRSLIDKFYPEGLPEPLCVFVIREVLQALEYLHKQGYIHRGVRASHTLLGSTGRVCLTGLKSVASLLSPGKRHKRLHTLPPQEHNNSNLIWLSPELLQQDLKGYDEKSDIYSVGMLCCELVNGAVPFADVPRTLMLTEKVRGTGPQLLDCTTFPQQLIIEDNNAGGADSGVGDSVAGGSMRQVYSSRRLSPLLHELCALCLQREPEDRPTAAQLLARPCLKQVRKVDSLPALLTRVNAIQPRTEDVALLQLEESVCGMQLDRAAEWDF